MSQWRTLPRAKYGNIPRRCRQNVMHQSGLEARWCDDLHVLQAGGQIRDLVAHPQPRLRLEVNGIHVCDYHPDFAWVEVDTGDQVYADAKGIRTREYELKRRLLYATQKIEVLELGRERGRR